VLCYTLHIFRVTTCMKNLEMSVILTAVHEMSGILLKVRKCRKKILSGKSGLKLFVVSCIFASILDFAEFVHFIFGFRSCTVAFLPPPLTIALALE